jgi:hypothetical protein
VNAAARDLQQARGRHAVQVSHRQPHVCGGEFRGYTSL